MALMLIKAFFIGGIICVIGQLLIDITKLTPARILVSFVCIGLLLGAVGIYPKLVEFAGAGATLPLTDFGNALAEGVRESVKKDGFIGIFTAPFTAMSGGVTVAVLAGLITALVTKPKDK
ncbi:MAG: stage V sporulation protein AE [Eubacterium sp.]|nr:stage V sporulation protein AE [Eubacterium sp.]